VHYVSVLETQRHVSQLASQPGLALAVALGKDHGESPCGRPGSQPGARQSTNHESRPSCLSLEAQARAARGWVSGCWWRVSRRARRAGRKCQRAAPRAASFSAQLAAHHHPSSSASIALSAPSLSLNKRWEEQEVEVRCAPCLDVPPHSVIRLGRRMLGRDALRPLTSATPIASQRPR
jgi:hypothetical protein